MSGAGSPYNVRTLFADRWQIPVALVAAAAAGVTLYQLAPHRPPLDPSALLADVAALEQAGATTDAADALANLLEMQPALPEPVQAELHERLADLLYQQELRRETPNLTNARLLLEHHDATVRLGRQPSADAALREGQVAEWLGNRGRAIPAYRAALSESSDPALRRRATLRLAPLLENVVDAHAERQRLLESLLADEGVPTGYLWWAFQQALEDALDENDTVHARLLLAKYGPRLRSSDLKGYASYLQAWVLLYEGRPEEAEPLVQWIDEWLTVQPSPEREVRRFGHLPAMNRWLLGQIHLAQRRPPEALAAFEEAAQLQPLGELLVAALAGQAQALEQLERYDAAREALHEAVSKLDALRGGERALDRLRHRLFTLFQDLVQKRVYDDAAHYVVAQPDDLTPERLAVLKKLAECQRQAHEPAITPDERRQVHDEMGRQFEHAAELARADEAAAAALLWSAAQAYDTAGMSAAAGRVLRRYLANRSTDLLIPQALLRLGRALQAEGQPEEALRTYERLLAAYPRLLEAAQAQPLRAECLLALGRADEAEAILRAILTDDQITPQAEVFRNALWALCELLFQQGRYGEAIGRLEEFAALCPDDSERFRGRFLLADAYRRSAEALRDSPPADVDGAQAAATARERFRQAAELYGGLLQAWAQEAPADPALTAYERLALFYRADCLFELSEPEALEAALDCYRQAAARYQREPAALTAQTQMANIYLRLGRLTDAARAVERARWLLAGIPDSAFTDAADGAHREHWNRFLAAISSSDLFRAAFADRP